MKIIFGFLAIYLWLGIIFAILTLLVLRDTHNQPDYKYITDHSILLAILWPILLIRSIRIILIYRKINKILKKTTEMRNDQISKCKTIVHDKSKDIDDRLDALELLGTLDYYFGDEDE